MMGTMLTGCSSSEDDDDEIVNNGNNSGADTNGENGGNANKSPYKSWLYNPFSLKNTYIEIEAEYKGVKTSKRFPVSIVSMFG